jgi:YHS domain-containing protein
VIRYILIAIVLLLLARAFWRLMDGVIEAAGGTRKTRPRSPAVKLVRDPVCGTFVSPRDSLSLAARDATHYFCSDECREQFRRRA